MPEIRKRYFIFAQVPKKYLEGFIKKMEANPKIGKVLEYDDVWFIGDGEEFNKPLPGSNPIGGKIEKSVLWICSCDPVDKEEVLRYINESHPWEVPMIYGFECDFPYPVREERETKHEKKRDFESGR